MAWFLKIKTKILFVTYRFVLLKIIGAFAVEHEQSYKEFDDLRE